ncbi:MAG: ECF transporter S component [Eubacteriales bacterium]|nr:ECF transporter S component [Eubacteriales bacterium]
MDNNIKSDLRKLILAAFFLALGLLLPFLTGQVPAIGKMLLPMHIPVLICGFICGWPYGLLVGFITPLFRSLLFGMPGMYPVALAMAAELAVYGLTAGILYKLLPKKIVMTYISLIAAMICGRIIWGVVSLILFGIAGNAFTFQAFMAGAVLNAVPGIILQLVIIPPIIIAVNKAEYK